MNIHRFTVTNTKSEYSSQTQFTTPKRVRRITRVSYKRFPDFNMHLHRHGCNGEITFRKHVACVHRSQRCSEELGLDAGEVQVR